MFYLAAVLVYYVQFHGFQEGAYAHLLSMPAVVNGYDAFESSYALLTGPYATLNITLLTFLTSRSGSRSACGSSGGAPTTGWRSSSRCSW